MKNSNINTLRNYSFCIPQNEVIGILNTWVIYHKVMLTFKRLFQNYL